MRWKWLLLFLLIVLLGAGVTLFKAYEAREQALHEPMPVSGDTLFTVEPGSSFRRVAQQMAGLGWVESARFFAWYIDAKGTASTVKAGTYAIEPGMSAIDAVELFVSGREIQYPFTIVEGWTFADLRKAVARESRLEQTLAEADDAAIMAALGHAGEHPEGMFLADTYLFAPGASDRHLLARARAAMQRLLETQWQARQPDLPLESPYQALILASIIEKETAAAAERPIIAGVFVERLRRDMLLQTDPTVIYGMGERFDGNIRRRDLRTDTPYNTYTRKGLPPTPIALVGPDALRAALNPEVDGSLFFVSRGDGSHQFSRTYAEHLRAVRRYQLGGRRSGKKSGGS